MELNEEIWTFGPTDMRVGYMPEAGEIIATFYLPNGQYPGAPPSISLRLTLEEAKLLATRVSAALALAHTQSAPDKRH